MIWWDDMPQRSEGFFFHYYAINQARLCICTRKTWQFCWISLPRALERRKREVTCAGTQRRPTRGTSLRIDLVESQSTDSRSCVYISPLVRKISFALNKYVCVCVGHLWYYLFTIQQVSSAEVLLTVSPWQ